MNILVYNYKAEILNAYNAHMLDFKLNLGFRITREMRMTIAGMDGVVSKQYHTKARNLVRELIVGKKVYVATNRPNLHGKTMCSVYIPVKKINMMQDHLVTTIAGIHMISYVRLLTYAADTKFETAKVRYVIESMEPYDA